MAMNSSQRMALQRRDFGGQLENFAVLVHERQREVFSGVVDATFQSIVHGSPITGAPGQPVDTGELRDSWTKRYETPTRAVISSDAPHALVVEQNVGGVRFSNHGPHSVKLTRVGFVELARRVARNIIARRGR